MPKMKTHKGIAKRVKITAKGRVKYKKSNAGHLMSGKSAARRRQLRRRGSLANKPLAARIVRALSPVM